MPRDTSDIGSQGLEQGGGNLGNDYSRSISTERSDQDTTPAVGSGSTENKGNESGNAGEEQDLDEAESEGNMPDPETLSKEGSD